MSSKSTSLDAQSNERKARLAQLRSLKRKAAQDDSVHGHDGDETSTDMSDTTVRYLSGRNYDPTTRGPKLGFDQAPTEGQVTLEAQAAEIVVDTTRWQAEEEEKADRTVDLFTLQPKKPNWDLKRDLDRKLERLNVRTENAIARLVRQRIQSEPASNPTMKTIESVSVGGDDGMGPDTVMDGTTLVEGVHLRERQDEEDERREREDDEMS